MAHSIIYQPDPKLDLLFERGVDAPRELVWKAWTTVHGAPPPWKAVASAFTSWLFGLVDRLKLGNK